MLDAGPSWRAILRRVLRTSLLALAGFLVVGNLAILALSTWAGSGAGATKIAGVKNFQIVDGSVWRGGAPTRAGYEALASAGAVAIVDLRAEDGLEVPRELLAARGVSYRRIAVRDGQTPTEDQVRAFLGIVRGAKGPVFVHCGAGVGRTGAMVAAYLASSGQAGGIERVRGNLAVGPPSLEQIIYAATLGADDFSRPNVAVIAASRLLDAPRRILHRLGI
ncbi:MAG: dual specificity protein phosphatase family protein [Actinobacteria bacterium]|nr:dual specificity protein phosphatase family protein [Actinomycetota bacterium]